MQSAIHALLGLGPLPSSATATVPTLQAFNEQLLKIQTPVTDEEACALAKLFGPDDCFGLAWTLLHLIETAPGWPVEGALDGLDGGWIVRHRGRAKHPPRQYLVSLHGVRDMNEFVAAFNIGLIQAAGGDWNGNRDAFNDYLSWPAEDAYTLVLEGWGHCEALSERDRAMFEGILVSNPHVTLRLM